MTPVLHIPYLSVLDNRPALEKAGRELRLYGARVSIGSQNWPDYTDDTSAWFYIAHSRDSIYVLFQAREATVKSVVDRDLGPVSGDSCFEFFILPDETSGRYWNFEFNASGRLNASHRVERPKPTRLGVEELNAVERLPSLGTVTFDERRVDTDWTLTVRIPFWLINVEYKGVPIVAHGNFYKCASSKVTPHYLSWAPIVTEKPDFHRPGFFGTLIFD